MGLREVYDLIAGSWSELKTKPYGFVVDFLNGKSGSLLVTGCGAGRHSLFAREQGFKVTGVDFSGEMIKLARSQDPVSDYLVADARELPFPDDSFDYSLSVAVLHHLKPGEAIIALQELKRVTRNQSLISVWRHPSLRGEQLIKWGEHERFYYLYDGDEFESLLKQVFSKVKPVSDLQNFVYVVE